MKKQSEKSACPGIEKFRLSELRPSKYNPRVISKDALAGLTNSISRFGCVEPIVVNTRGKKNTIIGGHQRYRALKRLKIKECICVTVNCSKGDEKLLNLTLNNPHIQGEFEEGIAAYIDELRAGLADQEAYLDLRIAELRGEIEEEKKGLVPDDDVPKPPKKARTKKGDLWILGKHRLLCGDSTKAADVKRLMGKHKADMVFTDPPYGINYLPASVLKKLGKIKSDKRYPEKYDEFAKWLTSWINIFCDYMDKGAVYYIWMSWQYLGAVEKAWRCKGHYPNHCIVWNRETPRFTPYPQDFLPVCEFCLYGWKRGKKRQNHNIKNAQRTSIWSIKTLSASQMLHTTEKPVALAENAIKMSSRKSNIILDGFLGSGSTLIACEKLDRRCYGMEIDPMYCDVTVKRWEQWTGKKAKLSKAK